MIDNLYYGGKPCTCCAGSPRNDLGEVIFSADILEDFLRKIYDGFDVSREIEPSAWREVLRILNEGAVKGLTQGGERQHTPQFLQAIKHSNEVFSAFKCHSMGVKMAERLHDKDGNLRPFKEWREAVQPIASHHVGAWLKTEYDTAVLRAHQGSLWQEFERNKDILPNLRWMPTTSVSPENVHKGYWTSRLTLPVDDSFWQDNHPANRWNCKCSLEATSDKADTGHVAEMARQDNTSQQGLENNPRDGHLFSDKHPYFPDSCSSCPFKKQSKLKNWIGRLFNKGGQKKDCYNCPYAQSMIDNAKIAEGEVYINSKEYGDRLQISIKADPRDLEDNKRVAKALLESFPEMKVKIRPHLRIKKKKNPEFKFNDKLIADNKKIEGWDGVTTGFKRAIKQECGAVVIDLDAHLKRLDIEKLSKGISDRKADFKNGIIKECYVVLNGKSVLITNHDRNYIRKVLARLKE